MSDSSITLPRPLIKSLQEAALATPEVEICGLIGHRPQTGHHLYPVPNVARHPQTRFELDPAGQVDAMRSMRERGETLFAIYHSHPDAAARPSAVDIDQAAYPEALYLIISLQDRGAPEVRGWWIREGMAEEITVNAEQST